MKRLTGLIIATIVMAISNRCSAILEKEDFSFGAHDFILFEKVATEAVSFFASNPYYEWNLQNGTIIITKYVGPGGVVCLPNTVYGWPITSIGQSAFYGFTNLTNITIPDSVTYIADAAFSGCTHLSGVYFEGNAPFVHDSAFEGATNVIVYYLLGTTGWAPTLADHPTALWLPQIQTGDANFMTRTNQFGFTIEWASGRDIVVEASTNLTDPVWSPVVSITLTSGSFYFSDPQWTNNPSRFYRIRCP